MIQIKNLSFRYEDEMILKNINLNINEGSYTAIIGANGSGKTTLAKHLNSLLLPAKGSVIVDDIDTKKNPEKIREKVGFVFQNPEDQLVYSIADEDIAFGLENLGMETAKMRSTVSRIMKRLGIESLAKKNVNMLSLGQKQLVALAGILVMNPKYIVFDEPTTMLDNKNKKTIMAMIKKLNKNHIGIILVTNIIKDIKDSDKVIVLNRGRVSFYGNKSKLTKSVLKRAGLDV
ncbi:ATP-binding cassette domain-containing protein [Candidatus Woesearchaeota archaeon]|nr:ATP-binding cassette domain-containing protein [Candidatus Woesearchaeota archaeon]